MDTNPRVLVGILVATAILSGTGTAQAAIQNLHVEYRTTPLGIDVEKPRFGWQMTAPEGKRGYAQIAYRIVVTDPEGDVVWDTKQSFGARALGIVYGGTPLRASTRYRWEVTVWDQTGATAAGSSWFETGLMDPRPGSSAWSGAAWIGGFIDPIPELGRDDHPVAPTLEHLRQEALAVTRPVVGCRVEEVGAEIEGPVKGPHRLRIIDVTPARHHAVEGPGTANGPAAQAEGADLDAGPTQRPSELRCHLSLSSLVERLPRRQCRGEDRRRAFRVDHATSGTMTYPRRVPAGVDERGFAPAVHGAGAEVEWEVQ